MGVRKKLVTAVAVAIAVVSAAPVLPSTAAGSPFTEFVLPAGNTSPADITYGVDGNLWTTDVDGSILKTATAGVTTVYQIPSQAAGSFPFPTGITLGPDGNHWFAEVNGGNIGRVTNAGVITEFPIPTGDMFNGIAPGWDGNLWFGSRTLGLVGRITPQGAYTDFTIPQPDGTHDPIGVTIGPHRSVWVSDESANTIWEVSTSGTFTAHPLPDPNRGPGAITVGWDGNLWFTESGPAIGRITPDGRYTEFATSDFPFAITPGLDGKMWFTEGSGKVGSITMTGVVREVTVPTPAGGFEPILHGITAGPDGNIWFTDADNGAIWRLSVPHRFARLPRG